MAKCESRSPAKDGLKLETWTEDNNDQLTCDIPSSHDQVFHKVKIVNRRIEDCEIKLLKGFYKRDAQTLEFKLLSDGSLDREWKWRDPFTVAGRRKTTAGKKTQRMASFKNLELPGVNEEDVYTYCEYQFDSSIAPQNLEVDFQVNL